jgi:hypothetical protein
MSKLKRYGRWVENPEGFIENPINCLYEVYTNNLGDHGHQCSRKRGYGPDGLYCKMHAKKMQERDNDAENADNLAEPNDDSMSQKEIDYEPIRYMELDLEDKKKQWLHKYGWEERCDFIDCGWRWCKEINGKLMMCDMSEAINLEYNYITNI